MIRAAPAGRPQGTTTAQGLSGLSIGRASEAPGAGSAHAVASHAEAPGAGAPCCDPGMTSLHY